MAFLRPITDMWLLAHPKLKPGVKFYGAFPAGFLERARLLLGASIFDPVLHVCGGKARDYLYPGGFGERDKTMDINAATNPDYCQDAREVWSINEGYRFILMDPPYSAMEARNYSRKALGEILDRDCGDVYPTPSQLLKRASEVLVIGGRVGILHWIHPSAPKGTGLECRAVIGVQVGRNTQIRVFTVFEKTS